MMMQKLWAQVFANRNLLAGLPLAYCLVSTRWEWNRDEVAWIAATLCCAGGSLLRAWARCHCNYARRRRKVLATTGPYAWTRNPLYTGNLLVIAGAGIASGLVWFLPILIIWSFAVYSASIRHEERRLEEKYGEAFAAYRSRVPRWGYLGVPLIRHRAWDVAWTRELIPVVLLQFTWSFIALTPFIAKELNALSLWFSEQHETQG